MQGGEKLADLFWSLRLFQTDAQTEAFLDELTGLETAQTISFMNAHAVNLAARDPEFFAALAGSDVLLRDGIGVKIGCRRLGLDPGLNLNGTDLIPRMLDRFKGKPIAVFGAEAEWLEKATGILRGKGHHQIIALDGFQPEEAYLAAAREAGPALIVMAMGMPKQERLAARLKTDLAAQGVPAVIVNGGAIVDFIAGKVIRAPAWIRSIGMEWAYRLAQEPARLAERYLIGNVTFLLRTARFQALRRPDKAA